MSIVPNPNADFSPASGVYTELKPFRFWCQKVLPLVYDDSLSYYELLCKVVDYLNKTMEDVDNAVTEVTALHAAYDQLEDYVNNYFSTLDVQQEINNKLDAMAESGELSDLISPFVKDWLPGVVEEQIPGVVGEQIGGTVAQQIGATVGAQIGATVAGQISPVVANWLDENITPTTPAVDATLSIAGAAADAAACGALKSAIEFATDCERITFTKGGYIVTNEAPVDPSAVTSDAGWYYAVLDCTPGEWFYVQANGGNAPRAYAFINSTDGSIKASELSGVTTRGYIIAPENSDKLIINKQSSLANYPSFIGRNLPDWIEGVESRVTTAEGNIQTLDNKADTVEVTLSDTGLAETYDSGTTDYVNTGKVLYGDAYWHDSQNYTVLAFLPVTKGDIVYYSGFTGTNSVVAILNGYADDDISSWTGFSVYADGETYTNKKIVIPNSDIKYVACCFRTSNSESYSVTVVHDLPEHINLLDIRTTSVFNQWYGKKIVWFGTSIPAAGILGLTQPYSYPKYVGNYLGATVYNEAVGSSAMHCKRIARISETNPYGFNANFTSVARALASSLEEKQWVINWLKAKLNGGVYVPGYENSCSFDGNVFTAAIPSTFTDGDEEFIKSCSWERKLTQYLGDGNRADLYVLDHGYNDYMLDDVNYNPSDPYNLYYFRGAMNFIIAKILADNPFAKIVVLTHYTDQLLPDVLSYGAGMIGYQEAVAEDWNIPCCKLYTMLGISSKYSFDTKWSVVDGIPTEGSTTTSKRTLDLYVPDDVHPSTNLTHKSLEYIAKNLSVWFNANLIAY